MKNKGKWWRVALIFIPYILVFYACSKEDGVGAPTIKLYQLGSHDEPYSGILFLDEYCHFEADIHAPGRIAKINVTIQQVSGYARYQTTTEYTGDFVGLQEVLAFHDHPFVDSENGGAIGDYLFTITVTDQLGQVVTISSDIKVEPGDGSGGHVHEPGT